MNRTFMASIALVGLGVSLSTSALSFSLCLPGMSWSLENHVVTDQDGLTPEDAPDWSGDAVLRFDESGELNAISVEGDVVIWIPRAQGGE